MKIKSLQNFYCSAKLLFYQIICSCQNLTQKILDKREFFVFSSHNSVSVYIVTDKVLEEDFLTLFFECVSLFGSKWKHCAVFERMIKVETLEVFFPIQSVSVFFPSKNIWISLKKEKEKKKRNKVYLSKKYKD